VVEREDKSNVTGAGCWRWKIDWLLVLVRWWGFVVRDL
jgi:hypothetical protein